MNGKRQGFVDQVVIHQEELKEMYEERQTGGVGRSLESLVSEASGKPGFMKPLSVRVPIHVLAQLDVLQELGPWKSRNEMICELLENAVWDVASALGEEHEAAGAFLFVATEALRQMSEPAEAELKEVL